MLSNSLLGGIILGLLAMEDSDPQKFTLRLPGVSQHDFRPGGIVRTNLSCVVGIEFRLGPPASRRFVRNGSVLINGSPASEDWGLKGTDAVAVVSFDSLTSPLIKMQRNVVEISPKDRPEYGGTWVLRDRGTQGYSEEVSNSESPVPFGIKLSSPSEPPIMAKDEREVEIAVRGQAPAGSSVRIQGTPTECRPDGNTCQFTLPVRVKPETQEIVVAAQRGSREFHTILMPVYWAGSVGGRCR